MKHPISETPMTTLKRGLFIVSIGSLYYLFMFYIRVLPSVMVDNLIFDLGITAKGVGLITSSFVIPYAIVQIPAGILVDKIGARKVMIMGMVGCAFGSYLFQKSTGLFLPVLSRAIIGISCGAAFIAPMALVKQWLPKNMFATAAGMIQLLGCLGAMLSTPAAYFVAELGWRDTFLKTAFIALFLIIIFSLLVKEKRPDIQQQQPLNIKKDLSALLKNPQVWYVGLIAMASWSIIGGFTESLGVKYLSELSGKSISGASMLMSFAWLSVALISPIAGYWSEHTANKTLPIVMMYSIALISFALLISGMVTHPTLIAVLLFLAALSAGGQPIAFGLIADIAPASVLATAVSFCNACVIAGAFVIQPLVSFTLDSVWSGESVNNIAYYSLNEYALSFLPITLVLLSGIMITRCLTLRSKT